MPVCEMLRSYAVLRHGRDVACSKDLLRPASGLDVVDVDTKPLSNKASRSSTSGVTNIKRTVYLVIVGDGVASGAVVVGGIFAGRAIEFMLKDSPNRMYKPITITAVPMMTGTTI